MLKSLDDYATGCDQSANALSIALGYSESFAEKLKSGTSLIFCGNPGTGKTHIACGIANVVLSKGNTALFTTVSEMIRAIRKSWTDRTVYEGDLINSFASPDLLIYTIREIDFAVDKAISLKEAS